MYDEFLFVNVEQVSILKYQYKRNDEKQNKSCCDIQNNSNCFRMNTADS